MFEKILVPVDGTELADRILEQVERLLLAEDAEVTLLRVVDPGSESERERETRAAGEDKHLSLRLDAARRDLEDQRARLAAKGVDARAHVETGDPAATIVAEAERLGSTLVAMGTHGRSGPMRWIRGSVAERVLRRCTAPVLLVSPKAEPGETAAFRRILVPLDGSERAARILPLTSELARRYGAEVLLLRVGKVVTAPMEYPVPEVVVPPSLDDLQASLEPYRQDLRKQGLAAVGVEATLDESEARAILEAAERHGSDLVAMTTHGRSGLDRWLFGSVAEKVLRHCTTPLLVMRVGGEGAEA